MADALQSYVFSSDNPALTSTAPAFTNFSLDANNDALEFFFQAPEAITITRLGIRLGAITGTTPTYRISLQGVTAAAPSTPNGTIKGATNNALKTFSPSGLGWADGSWNWLTLDETYTTSRGEVLAMVVDYSSGTVDGSNFASFTHQKAGESLRSFPRAITNAAGVRSHQEAWPVFGYGSSGAAYGRPCETVTSVVFDSGSSPREVGIRFTIPATWGATYKLAGFDVFFNQANSSSNVTARLYQGGGASDVTVLQDISISNGTIGQGNLRKITRILFDEVTLSTLNYGDTYRLSLENTITTDCIMWYFETDAAADMAAYPGGESFYWTQRDSGGNWADTATRRPILWQPIFSDITEPTGGAGMLVHPGMTGGLRG